MASTAIITIRKGATSDPWEVQRFKGGKFEVIKFIANELNSRKYMETMDE